MKILLLFLQLNKNKNINLDLIKSLNSDYIIYSKNEKLKDENIFYYKDVNFK